MRRATLDDLRSYYGGDPPATVRAWALLLDGKVMGVLGIAYGGLARERSVPEVFSESREEFAPYRNTMPVIAAIKDVMRLVKRTKPTPIAIADKRYPQSEQVLRRLGAVRIGTCEQGEIYQWPN